MRVAGAFESIYGNTQEDTVRKLLKNCDILFGEPSEGQVIRNGYLGIDGAVIESIGQDKPEGSYDEIKDMKGCLLMPGLINCHCHAPMVLLRGVGSDLPLQEWLFDRIMPIEAMLKEEDIIAGTQLAVMEMLAGGTTSFTDMYDYPAQTAQVVAESGIRANLCMPLVCQDPEIKGGLPAWLILWPQDLQRNGRWRFWVVRSIPNIVRQRLSSIIQGCANRKAGGSLHS